MIGISINDIRKSRVMVQGRDQAEIEKYVKNIADIIEIELN